MSIEIVGLRKFKCPKGKTNRDAICPTCEFNKEGECKGSWNKLYPGACGCGGGYDCKCGFLYKWCMRLGHETEIECPYCKRKIKSYTTQLMKTFDIKDFKIELPKEKKFKVQI